MFFTPSPLYFTFPLYFSKDLFFFKEIRSFVLFFQAVDLIKFVVFCSKPSTPHILHRSRLIKPTIQLSFDIKQGVAQRGWHRAIVPDRLSYHNQDK